MRFHPWSLLACFLFAATARAAGPAAAPGAGKIDFVKQVWPLFEKKCIGCHGPEKQKAKLRLDTPDAILKGSKDEKVVLPGKGKDSLMYQRVSLAKDHEDLMPPEGEGDPLTKQEQELILRWIDGNADFGGWKGLERKADVAAAPPLDKAALEKLRTFGALAMPIHQNTTLLMVDFGPVADKTKDEHLALLEPLAANVVWLDLGRTKITDTGLDRLKRLAGLERLHLEGTQLGDAALARLAGAQKLSYLNLYGTKVTDKGLAQLKPLAALKKVFLWQTGVTEQGHKELKKARPELLVDIGRAPSAEPAASPGAAPQPASKPRANP